MGKKFNEILIGLRKSSGLTQEEFAKKIGVSRSAIGNYIYGNFFRREKEWMGLLMDILKNSFDFRGIFHVISCHILCYFLYQI